TLPLQELNRRILASGPVRNEMFATDVAATLHADPRAGVRVIAVAGRGQVGYGTSGPIPSANDQLAKKGIGSVAVQLGYSDAVDETTFIEQKLVPLLQAFTPNPLMMKVSGFPRPYDWLVSLPAPTLPQPAGLVADELRARGRDTMEKLLDAVNTGYRLPPPPATGQQQDPRGTPG